MIICPSCNHQNEVGSSFCENCGHDLREMAQTLPSAGAPPAAGGLTCSNCGYSNISGAAFCENCGNPLEQRASSVPSPVVPQAAPQPAGDLDRCSVCGHQNVPGSRFCENCGSEVKQAPPVAPPQVAPKPQPESLPQPVPQQVPPPQRMPATGEQLCHQCGFSNPSGTRYCGNCGVLLVETPPAPSVVEPPLPEPSAAPVVSAGPPPSAVPVSIPSGMAGRFNVQQSGATISLPAGKNEAIIGREDPVSGIFPEIDLDPHGGHDGGVGRRHARLFVQGGQLMVEDQDSVNGTFVNRQKLNAFQPHHLRDGDELRLGKIVLTYHAS